MRSNHLDPTRYVDAQAFEKYQHYKGQELVVSECIVGSPSEVFDAWLEQVWLAGATELHEDSTHRPVVKPSIVVTAESFIIHSGATSTTKHSRLAHMIDDPDLRWAINIKSSEGYPAMEEVNQEEDAPPTLKMKASNAAWQVLERLVPTNSTLRETERPPQLDIDENELRNSWRRDELTTYITARVARVYFVPGVDALFKIIAAKVEAILKAEVLINAVTDPAVTSNLDQAFFSSPYSGDADVRFFRYLMRCCKLYSENPAAYTAPYVTIMQSSGFGKSRILYEVAKKIADPNTNLPESELFDCRLLAVAYACSNWEAAKTEWIGLFGMNPMNDSPVSCERIDEALGTALATFMASDSTTDSPTRKKSLLHYVNFTYDAHISGYVTEPVLTFGATHLWYEIDPLPLEKYVLPQFLKLLLQGLIDVGSVGEVVARIILLLAMDATSMGRRAAGVFPRNQKAADLIIPIFSYPSNMDSDARISFILIQVKNKSGADRMYPQSALNNLTPANLFQKNEINRDTHELSKFPARDIIRIFMSLRESNRDKPAQSYLVDTEGTQGSYSLCLRATG
ncbi:uncharacterized protein PITG_12241 [Phytophthora infestans T30-4]|uniref:Uncharacterized protein n=1 Tax=Phytophthora infestans (strain T30-4) TaxID=403677 RepID=D0NJE0_PHYIT|nr:uncharacterized protein PITG_12241 [Phytophthora infestans T30-4]EEY59658.1 conserved hypothetical protein [Phytophthora infestans T30-4]|eukprot:XP_002900851.1 conserved hypothetical protein [Phytophthora infestans T30-4]